MSAHDYEYGIKSSLKYVVLLLNEVILKVEWGHYSSRRTVCENLQIPTFQEASEAHQLTCKNAVVPRVSQSVPQCTAGPTAPMWTARGFTSPSNFAQHQSLVTRSARDSLPIIKVFTVDIEQWRTVFERQFVQDHYKRYFKLSNRDLL